MEPVFRDLFNSTLFAEFNLIRKTGNAVTHGNKISQQDVLASLKYLFLFLRFLANQCVVQIKRLTNQLDTLLVPMILFSRLHILCLNKMLPT